MRLTPYQLAFTARISVLLLPWAGLPWLIGLTMRAVLAALPRVPRVHAFCLRAVAENLSAVAELAPVTAGFAASGRILEDVSFINASGLVKRGAIRRKDRPPLAFYERPEWMAAWFPTDHEDITALCRELAAEPDR